VTVRVGRVTGALEPPQPARDKEREPASNTAKVRGMLRKEDLTGAKNTKGAHAYE